MKYVKIFRVLAAALLLALLIATLPSTPALAAESLRISPASGKVGDNIELWGSGFVSDTYKLYFSDEVASVGEDIDTDVLNYASLGGFTVGTSGSFEGKYFDVPSRLRDGDVIKTVRGGTYYVYATGPGNSKNILARVSFTVAAAASITLDPEKGTVGTEVKITGEGFSESENIIVEYDGNKVNIVGGDKKTDSSGKFANTKIKIPPSTAGAHTITVTGDDSDIEAEAEFTVEPKITITPESGAVGSTITVSGTGFGDEVDVTITFNAVKVAPDKTDGDGSFEVSFPVPSKAAGSYTVEATDGDNSADADFTVATTAVNISPITGTAGTEVTINGSGFKERAAITITFADVSVAPNTNSDANGGFSASFTVPNKATGTYKVKATDGSNAKEVDFTISIGGNISPETGNVGTPITISGVGFTPGGTVTITYDGSQLPPTTVDSNGSFSFNAPASKSGGHTITATDGVNTTPPFSFIMESTPPPTPVPLKPEMNVKAQAETYFDWQDVTDLSGVTYSLEVATDKDFSQGSIVLEKTGINNSEYTIPKAQRLKSVSKEAPYYWHVKAIDSASNESQWSGTGSFYVGTSLALPQPVLYTLIGVGVLLLALLAFWLGRKTAYY